MQGSHGQPARLEFNRQRGPEPGRPSKDGLGSIFVTSRHQLDRKLLKTREIWVEREGLEPAEGDAPDQ